MALTWDTHAALSIVRKPSVRREEYLDYMTFQGTNARCSPSSSAR